MNFEVFSKYWASPLSNGFVVIAAILILYPVIWRVSVRQLSAAIQALNAAKELPKTVSDLNSASDRLSEVNAQIASLREKLSDLDGINQQLEVANRQIADLQKLTEARPVEATLASKSQSVVEEETERWQQVSQLWFDVKDYIEKQVAGIGDGRISRKYNSIPRYTYEEIVGHLKADGYLSKEKGAAVVDMDRWFRSIRNRRTPVTLDILNTFKSLHAKALT